MQIIWTREALDRLKEIKSYIAADNPDRANQFIDYLIDQGERLAEQPRIGRIVPELGDPDIREIIVKKYRIVYRTRKDQIQVLSVFRGNRLFNINFEKL